MASKKCSPRGTKYRAVSEVLERRTLFATAALAGFADEPVTGGLSAPTAMEFAPDGRLFVTQQGGAIRVIKNGALLPNAFASFNVDAAGERGLLGIAFDPNYATNGFVYVYHTVPGSPGVAPHNRVTRITADPQNPDRALASATSPLAILDLDPLSGATNHNGGAIHFGTDGRLYVAVGDNANSSNAQTLANRHGKILRINPDGSIPANNPFFNVATGANRAIWAVGLRNPFTFAVHPGSGLLHINDVGEGMWEEVNVGQAGANYGWGNPGGNIEGPRTTQPLPTIGTYVDPLHAYLHPGNGRDPTTVGIAISGGAFYSAAAPTYPVSYQGDYFFADLGGGWIRKLEAGTGSSSPFASGLAGPVDLKVGPDGKLYYLEINAGRVGRIAANTPRVTSVVVNAGVPQRSRVSNVEINFSRPVQLEPGAVTVINRSGPVIGMIVNVSAGTTNFNVTFSGHGVDADGSLPDGVYDLTIAADKVRDALQPTMTLPANFTTRFHRLLADSNGDARIGPEDFNILATNFGLTGQTPGTGDFNGDGTVGPEDFNLLAARFGTTLIESPVPAALAAEPPPTPARQTVVARRSLIAAADTTQPAITIRPAYARQSSARLRA